VRQSQIGGLSKGIYTRDRSTLPFGFCATGVPGPFHFNFLKTMMKTLKHLLSFTLMATVLAACDSNPAGEHEHGHADIAGLVLEMDGQEVVEVANAQVTGTIVVQAGEESPDITVEWRDSDGDHFHDEDLDEDLTLGHVVANESVATFEHHAGIHGEGAGNTTVELQLFNVDHVDFRTPPIPIEVNE
jgi:hypothetical protein